MEANEDGKAWKEFIGRNLRQFGVVAAARKLARQIRIHNELASKTPDGRKSSLDREALRIMRNRNGVFKKVEIGGPVVFKPIEEEGLWTWCAGLWHLSDDVQSSYDEYLQLLWEMGQERKSALSIAATTFNPIPNPNP